MANKGSLCATKATFQCPREPNWTVEPEPTRTVPTRNRKPY